MREPEAVFQAPLIQQAGRRWKDATESSFLQAVESGEISNEVFGRWLAQDYFFARGLLRFQSIALAKVSRNCHAILIGGLVALDSELSWFEGHAGRLGLDLTASVHAVCQRYNDYLLRSAYTESPGVLLAILFGVEVSYLQAWSALRPEGPYREFIERWSSPDFAEYVASLRTLTEENSDAGQQTHFNRVLDLERDFWRMAWEG